MRTVTLALLTLCCLATAAHAQRRREDEDTLPPSKPPAVSTLAPIPGIAGLRLDPGAVICRSEDDLMRRVEVNQRREDGDADPGDPLAGCRILTQARGVEVVARHGLARSEVKLKPSGEVGWTDTYLR